jgi:hypothetical protein
MDLDQAMLLLARMLGDTVVESELTGRVRASLISSLTGGRVAGLSDAEEQRLRAWLTHKFGPEPDSAAALYQELLERVLVREDGGKVAVRREPGAHRATGAYYTQTGVVSYMVRQACRHLPGARSVIDPACGAGAFLEEAGLQVGLDARLVGLDTDALALSLCKRNVPGAELYPADALLGELPAGAGSFDLCLGNPPYISTGMRGAAESDPERLAALRRRYPATAQYKLNTYPLFVERGLELLRPGGVLGYVLPDSFLSGRYFERIRQLLLSHTILELTLVCEDFWAHGLVGQSVILLVRKGSAPAGHQVDIRVCRGVEDLERASVVTIPLSELVWGARQRFRLIPNAAVRSLVRTMEATARAQPLSAVLVTYSGLIGRKGQASLLRSANPGLAGPWGRLLRSGKEIDRYWLWWGGEEVCLDPTLIKSGGRLDHYRQPKLLLRQTADTLRAVYDDQHYFCLNNIHVLVPRAPGVNLHTLLALLNSGAADRYYRAMTMESGRVYPQVDLDILESLPVPVFPEPTARRLAELVQKRQGAAPVEAARTEYEIDALVAACYGIR